MQDQKDIIVKYVGDQLAADHHTLHVVKTQLEDSDVKEFPEVVSLLNRIRGVLKEHTDHMERHLKDDLGEKGGNVSGALKYAVTEVTGNVIGLYNKIRSEKVSKMLRDDYVALSMCSLTYTMLHATALAVGHQKTADIALEHLNHLPSFVIELNSVIPSVVVAELSKKGLVENFDADSEALKRSREAWSSTSDSSLHN